MIEGEAYFSYISIAIEKIHTEPLLEVDNNPEKITQLSVLTGILASSPGKATVVSIAISNRYGPMKRRSFIVLNNRNIGIKPGYVGFLMGVISIDFSKKCNYSIILSNGFNLKGPK